MQINWTIKKFEELNPGELYHILQLRNNVFVVEQNCVYQDADGKDIHALHVCGWDNDKLAAYARIIPKGISYTEASIGRVLTAPGYRRKGLGIALMQKCIVTAFSSFNCDEIRIGAQVYLTRFYQSLGFIPCSNEYLEDGIPHREMIIQK